MKEKPSSIDIFGKSRGVRFVESSTVKQGVVCDVYAFVDDNSQDLAVVSIEAGEVSPKQLLSSGDETIEYHVQGMSNLRVERVGGTVDIYNFPGDERAVAINEGDVMQWCAIEDLVFYELCTPPYTDGRFKDL